MDVAEEETPGSGPLLPRRLRGPLLGLTVSSAGLVVVLGVLYHGEKSRDGFDQWVVDAMPWGIPVRSPTVWALGAHTGMAEALLLAVLLAVVLGVQRRWWLAVLALAGPAVTVAATVAGKHLVHREFYDDPGTLAYPSGHTAGMTAVALVTALAVLDRTRAHVVATGLAAMLAVVIVAATVGLIMVLLNGHYATDVIGGFCTACAATLGTAWAVDEVRSTAQWQPRVGPR